MQLKNVTFSVFYLFFSVDKWLKNVLIRLKNVIFKNQKASKHRGFQTYPQLKTGSLYYYYIIYIINNI